MLEYFGALEDIIPCILQKSAVVSLLLFGRIQLPFSGFLKILSVFVFAFYCVNYLCTYPRCGYVTFAICGLISPINFQRRSHISSKICSVPFTTVLSFKDSRCRHFNCKSCLLMFFSPSFCLSYASLKFFQTYLLVHYFFHNLIQSLVKVRY